jgi:hypothetical protein
VREISTVIDDDCWKKVWADMTDSQLENRLFTYLWLSFHSPNSHTGRVAQLIAEAERRGQAAMVERARVKAETTRVGPACGSRRHEAEAPIAGVRCYRG